MKLPLSQDAALEILTQIENGEPPAELRGKRYVVMHGLDAWLSRDPTPDDDPLMTEPERFALRVVGEASDFDEALRILWRTLAALYLELDFGPAGFGEERKWTASLKDWLVNAALGFPKSDAEAAGNFALYRAKSKFPRSRFVLAAFGDAPYEGESACILELPTLAELSKADKKLFVACRAGDLAKAEATLAAGASPSALNAYGNTPLHYAVARRDLALVRTLVASGADVNAQKENSHSPLFAAYRGVTRVGPFADRIDDADHFEILKLLLEHGADIASMGPTGETLLDLAAASVPLHEPWARFFIERGASTKMMNELGYHRTALGKILSGLDSRSPEDLKRLPGRVRILGWLGCDPNARDDGFSRCTPVEDFLKVGYHAHEVDPAAMIELAHALVDIGLRDEPNPDGRRPSDLAENRALYVKPKPHYAEMARIFKGETGKRA